MSRYIYIFFCCFCLSVIGYSKTIKAESSVVAIKKILKRCPKDSGMCAIRKSIDLNLLSTDLWNEQTNDTVFLVIFYDWQQFVSVLSRDFHYYLHNWSEKGIRTVVYDSSTIHDAFIDKIKQWNVELFSSWKEYPKGCYSVDYQTVYRIIRKKTGKYEYSSYTFYDYSFMYLNGPLYPTPEPVLDYYYK